MATGKHPAVRDYFRIGRTFSLAAGIADWLDTGYRHYQKVPAFSACSWRFWVRGGAGDDISCGILRDSCDSIGRPYPLLVMGSGALAGWQDHWDLVPLACERIWAGMEALSTCGADGVASLEASLGDLPSPGPAWDAQGGETSGDAAVLSPGEYELFADKMNRLSGRESGFILLAEGDVHEGSGGARLVGGILRGCVPLPPVAVFVGGTAEVTWFAFFRRPLKVTDFTTLWRDLPQRGEMEGA